MQPGQQAGFDVQFMPSAAGTRTGSLAVGARVYPLAGTGVAPAMPKPQLTIALPLAQSAQQGTVSVTFTGPTATAGSGIVTLQFLPAVTGTSDRAVAFASGGQSAPFTFAAGDIQASFGAGRTAPFQTATTAGRDCFLGPSGQRFGPAVGFNCGRASGLRFDPSQPFGEQSSGSSSRIRQHTNGWPLVVQVL